jgi:hypothetical protein
MSSTLNCQLLYLVFLALYADETLLYGDIQVFDCKLHGCSQDLVFPVSFLSFKVISKIYLCLISVFLYRQKNSQLVLALLMARPVVNIAIRSVLLCEKFFNKGLCSGTIYPSES